MDVGISIIKGQGDTYLLNGENEPLSDLDDASKPWKIFSDVLLLVPPFLEGKSLDVSLFPFWKQLMIEHQLKKLHRKQSNYVLSLLKDGKITFVTYIHSGLSDYLVRYGEANGYIPKIYLLDNIFFGALRRTNQMIKGWCFLVIDMEDHYRLSCFSFGIFVFQRAFPKVNVLKDELLASFQYIHRFGYKDEELNVFFFSNIPLLINTFKNKLPEKMRLKRIPYHFDDIVEYGLSPRLEKTFLPPFIPTLNKTFLASFLKKTMWGMWGILICACISILCLEWLYPEHILEIYRHTQDEEKELPEDHGVYMYLNERKDKVFHDQFCNHISQVIKSGKNAQIEMDYSKNTIKFYFNERQNIKEYQRRLKKLLPKWSSQVGKSTLILTLSNRA